MHLENGGDLRELLSKIGVYEPLAPLLCCRSFLVNFLVTNVIIFSNEVDITTYFMYTLFFCFVNVHCILLSYYEEIMYQFYSKLVLSKNQLKFTHFSWS